MRDLSREVMLQTVKTRSLRQRFGEAWDVFTGRFSPAIPITPVEQEAEPRAWQYQVGTNLNFQPRSTEALTPFAQLRFLADTYDIARIAIASKTQEIAGLDWDIVRKDRDNQTGEAENPKAKSIKTFLQRPDQDHDWAAWLSIFLEEVLVTDALTIYPRKTRGGDLYALEIIDGTTIKPLIDLRGRRPLPPAPAYQQILYGAPWFDALADMGYQRNEDGAPVAYYDAQVLRYLPMHPRASSMYGRSPLEWVIITVNTALRRQYYDLAYYTEGNVPEGLIGVPEGWTPDQIKTFQDYWDALLTGNVAGQRRLKMVPNTGSGTLPVYEFKKPDINSDQLTWLLKVTCAAFGVPPAEIGFTDHVNRATASSQENINERRGLVPYKRFIKNIIDQTIATDFGAPNLEFMWLDDLPQEDEQSVSQIDDLYIKNGVLSIDEVRERKGLKPLGVKNFVLTASGPIMVTDLEISSKSAAEPAPAPVMNHEPFGNEPGDDKKDPTADGDKSEPSDDEDTTVAKVADLTRWKKVALTRLEKGKAPRLFRPDALTGSESMIVRALLAEAEGPDDIREVFAAAKDAISKAVTRQRDEPDTPPPPPTEDPLAETQDAQYERVRLFLIWLGLQFVNGFMDISEFMAAMQAVLDKEMQTAFARHAGHLPTAQDAVALAMLAQARDGYLRRFAATLDAGKATTQVASTDQDTPAAGVEHRAGLYVRELILAAALGVMSGLTATDTVTWHCEDDEGSCKTCRDMAGEHSIQDLQSGGILPGRNTDCRANCRCWLSRAGEEL